MAWVLSANAADGGRAPTSGRAGGGAGDEATDRVGDRAQVRVDRPRPGGRAPRRAGARTVTGAGAPPRTLAALVDAERAGRGLGYLFFWSHRPGPGGGVGPQVLSQWFEHPFEVEGVTYPTAEHYMMAEKARLFDDDETLELVLGADGPAAAKELGRQVRGFDERRWVERRFDIVVRASTAKFGADDTMLGYLIGTAALVLVEASPHDRVWGIGLDARHPDARRPSRWPGENLLGFALMEARARLMAGD